jgi:hypothetical protein
MNLVGCLHRCTGDARSHKHQVQNEQCKLKKFTDKVTFPLFLGCVYDGFDCTSFIRRRRPYQLLKRDLCQLGLYLNARRPT